MRKIFLLFVCICLAFTAFGARKRKVKVIYDCIFSCKNGHRYLPPAVKKFKITKTGHPICPKCGETLYANPIQR